VSEPIDGEDVSRRYGMTNTADRDASLDAFERKLTSKTVRSVLFDADQVKALIADARRELVERCIETAWRWAVLRGGHEPRLAAEDIARELRAELKKITEGA
jgi:hypothetical protein